MTGAKLASTTITMEPILKTDRKDTLLAFEVVKAIYHMMAFLAFVRGARRLRGALRFLFTVRSFFLRFFLRGQTG